MAHEVLGGDLDVGQGQGKGSTLKEPLEGERKVSVCGHAGDMGPRTNPQIARKLKGPKKWRCWKVSWNKGG